MSRIPRSTIRGCIPLTFGDAVLGYIVHGDKGWQAQLGGERPRLPDLVGRKALEVRATLRATWHARAVALPPMGTVNGATGAEIAALWQSHVALLVYAALTAEETQEAALVCSALRCILTLAEKEEAQQVAERVALLLMLMERLRVALVKEGA